MAKTKHIGEAAKGLGVDVRINSNLIDHDLASVNLNAYYQTNPTDYQIAPVPAPEQFIVDTTLQDLVVVENNNIDNAESPASTPIYTADMYVIDMGSYIQNPTSKGAVVINGTEEDDYLYGGYYDNTKNTIVNGLGGDDYLFADSENTILNGGTGRDMLIGSQFDDIMNGGSGIDAAMGGDGNDIINGDEGHDGLDGNAGNDTINGGEGHDVMRGGEGNDILIGGEGNDVLIVSEANYDYDGGKDILFGGAGIDTFAFSAAGTSIIADFVHGEDRIYLERHFYENNEWNYFQLADNNFVQGVGAVAKDANDYIIFDTSTGALYYDADGNGTEYAAFQFATLIGVKSLSAADFTPYMDAYSSNPYAV